MLPVLGAGEWGLGIEDWGLGKCQVGGGKWPVGGATNRARRKLISLDYATSGKQKAAHPNWLCHYLFNGWALQPFVLHFSFGKLHS